MKNVNNFNHSIDKYIMLPKEIEISSREFQNLMKTVQLMTNMKDKI